MALGVLIVGAAVGGLFFVTSVWQALALQVVSGVGSALWNVSRHAYLTTGIPPGARGRAIALFGGVTRLGIFAGPALGGLMAGALGLRAPFLVVALLAVLTAALAALFTERADLSGSARHAPVSPLGLLVQYRGVLLTAGIGQLLAQMIRGARFVVVPLYASGVLGLGVESVGLLMSAASLVDMLMFYPAGVLMDRLGRKAAIIPSFALQGVGMLLIPLTGSFWGLLAAASLIGFANGLGSGTMMTLGSDLAPRESLGEFLGVWRLIGDIGGVGGPVAVGTVADALTLESAAVVLGLVGFAAAAVFAFGVPETAQRERRA
jgi:MFS family permease